MKNASKRERRGSLQVKLIAMITAVLVAFTLLLSVIDAKFIRYSTVKALEQSMRQTAKIAADYVADYLELKVSLVQSIANRVGALYDDYIVPDYEDCDIAFLERQTESMALAYGFDMLFAVDADGLARTKQRGDIGGSGLDYYVAVAVEGRDSYMSDVSLDGGMLSGSVINISAPIVDEGGKNIGVLVAKLDAALISELVAGINVGENGSTFVMNAQGMCIAHTNLEMCFGGSIYAQYKNNPLYSSLNRLWDDMRDNSAGFASYDYNGPRYAAYYTVPGTSNWAIAVTTDESEFMATADASVLTSVLVAIGFMVLAFFVCLAVIRPILRRISRVTERLERLSRGDLSGDVAPDRGHDEVGRLAFATGALVDDLGRMIDTVSDALSDMAEGKINATLDGEFSGDFARLKTAVERNLSKLGALVKQISRTAEEVSRGSSQIAEGATSLAQGAAEQAGSIEELYNTVAELTVSAKEIANPDARYLDESESEATDESDAGRIEAAPTLVDKLTSAMDSIKSRLNEIRKISVAIDGMASETGMLALNASVEATHAGEYGKGFAIIAADVRQLSEKCRHESRNAGEQIESIMRAVERGDKVVDFTIDSVARIAQALSQVEAALSQISGVIDGTAATAEESAAGSEELSAQAEVLKELASAFTYEEG